MTVAASTPIELIHGVYSTLDERVDIGRHRLGRALTLAEKVLVNHLDDPENAGQKNENVQTGVAFDEHVGGWKGNLLLGPTVPNSGKENG